MNSHSEGRTTLLKKQENLQMKISLQLDLLSSSILMLKSKKTNQPVPRRMWGHKTIKIANKYSPVPPPLVEQQLPAVETPNTAHSPTKPNTDRRSITYLLRVISRLEQKHGHAPVALLPGSGDKVPSPVPQVFETLWDNAITFSQHLPEREPLHVPPLTFRPPPPFSRPRFPHRPPPTKFIPPPPRLPPLLPVFVPPSPADRGASRSNGGPSGGRHDFVPDEGEYYEDDFDDDEEWSGSDEEWSGSDEEGSGTDEYTTDGCEEEVSGDIQEDPDYEEFHDQDDFNGRTEGLESETEDLDSDEGGDWIHTVEDLCLDEDQYGDPDLRPDRDESIVLDEGADYTAGSDHGEDLGPDPAPEHSFVSDWRDWGHSSVAELVTSSGWLEPSTFSCSWDNGDYGEEW